ncbi:unnamed protein product [Adineta steineri]|uniref:CBM21 domain-containing protein n=1 Tax=Adineta steineri TaxID=433720 RepID=A0A814U0V6_9BILA|nr:unnamed protein product [Adineta steineri]CAF3651657.1 unnamed protein product [Adineta steineri]
MHFIVRELDNFEDLNHSSTSIINYNPQIDLPSLENSTMAHMLVQQQQTHRTPNMNLHQTTSTENESLLPMSHSVDDRIFYYKQDSTSILHFLQRFASEPHLPMYPSTSNGYLSKTSPSSSLSNIFLPVNETKEEQEQKVNTINCDTIQPVTVEDVKSDTSDTISSKIIVPKLNEDILVNTTSISNTERHFRRRKRRSSLTHSLSLDDSELSKTDCIRKIDDNNNNNNEEEEKLQEISTDSQSLSLESVQLNENNEKKDISVETEESNEIITPPSQLRSRRLRYRFHRHTPSITTQESIPDSPVEFFISNETPSSPQSQPQPPTPPLSPTTTISSTTTTSSNTLSGGLKRNASIGTTKKMVRFADSCGRELAQVQYIESPTDDNSKDILYTKNRRRIPSTLDFEPKPWSFDFASTSKQNTDIRKTKRFFCLYRQPNSEHPDIYLHEIWKSQIKLEHADIRPKSTLTGEQSLYGTVWVTNCGYWKNVTVKYSFNRWLNTYEYEAQHRCHSNDFRNIDQFDFSIDIPQDVDRIDFVLRYHVNGQEHWDNNEGKNYTIETESSSVPQTTISLPHDCDFNEMRFY